MRSVLGTALDCVVGALVQEPGPEGIALHRAPAAGRAQLADDDGYLWCSSVPSGVRFELLTDAGALEIEARFIELLPIGAEPGGARVDVVVDGELREPVVVRETTLVFFDPETFETEVRPAPPATIRIEPGAAGAERRVEVWLPNAQGFRLVDVRVPDGAILRPAPASGPLWVHYGSSVSQCSEAERPTATWPALVARAAGRSLVNLALGGQCHLDPFAARAIRDRPADVISLELGINIVNGDTMRERTFVPALHGFLDTVREGHPTTPVLISSPFVCPAAEHRPGPTMVGPDGKVFTPDRPVQLATGALTLTRIRELMRAHVELRRKDGDGALHLVDGLTLFGPADVDHLPDGLHPDTTGYARIAERFLPVAFGAEGVLR